MITIAGDGNERENSQFSKTTGHTISISTINNSNKEHKLFPLHYSV